MSLKNLWSRKQPPKQPITIGPTLFNAEGNAIDAYGYLVRVRRVNHIVSMHGVEESETDEEFKRRIVDAIPEEIAEAATNDDQLRVRYLMVICGVDAYRGDPDPVDAAKRTLANIKAFQRGDKPEIEETWKDNCEDACLGYVRDYVVKNREVTKTAFAKLDELGTAFGRAVNRALADDEEEDRSCEMCGGDGSCDCKIVDPRWEDDL